MVGRPVSEENLVCNCVVCAPISLDPSVASARAVWAAPTSRWACAVASNCFASFVARLRGAGLERDEPTRGFQLLSKLDFLALVLHPRRHPHLLSHLQPNKSKLQAILALGRQCLLYIDTKGIVLATLSSQRAFARTQIAQRAGNPGTTAPNKTSPVGTFTATKRLQ